MKITEKKIQLTRSKFGVFLLIAKCCRCEFNMKEKAFLKEELLQSHGSLREKWSSEESQDDPMQVLRDAFKPGDPVSVRINYLNQAYQEPPP